MGYTRSRARVATHPANGSLRVDILCCLDDDGGLSKSGTIGGRRHQVGRFGGEIDRPPDLQPHGAGANTGIHVDLGKHEVYVDGRKVIPEIQNREFDLISVLFEAGGNVVTMDEISRRLWRDRWQYEPEIKDRYGEVIQEAHWFEEEDSKTNPGEIHQLVRRLRRKLNQYSNVEYVQSVRAKGYKLV